MRIIHSKLYVPFAKGEIRKTASIVDFLMDVPALLNLGYIPPFNILNSVLLTGDVDAGMGGGAEWEPFVVSQDEYNEIVRVMLSDPDTNYLIDEEILGIDDFYEWFLAIGSKHFEGGRELVEKLRNHLSGAKD
jgi:hypothetical protein